jgi:diamine N-acetyltransferase
VRDRLRPEPVTQDNERAACQEAVRRGQQRLTVCYHPRPHGPEGFYQRLGFSPTGEWNEGEVVAERILPAR